MSDFTSGFVCALGFIIILAAVITYIYYMWVLELYPQINRKRISKSLDVISILNRARENKNTDIKIFVRELSNTGFLSFNLPKKFDKMDNN